MSYILDALRKSEAERRQGKAPDLGQQVQMVYRPKKKPVSAITWVALALLVNAGVLAYVLWPGKPIATPAEPREQAEQPEQQPIARETAAVLQAEPEPEPTAPAPDVPVQAAQALPESGFEEPMYAQPVVIVPSLPVQREFDASTQNQPQGRVPPLVGLPLSFQPSVPDLPDNSHNYSSDPSASRGNNHKPSLSRGQSFGQFPVETTTEDGVVL